MDKSICTPATTPMWSPIMRTTLGVGCCERLWDYYPCSTGPLCPAAHEAPRSLGSEPNRIRPTGAIGRCDAPPVLPRIRTRPSVFDTLDAPCSQVSGRSLARWAARSCNDAGRCCEHAPKQCRFQLWRWCTLQNIANCAEERSEVDCLQRAAARCSRSDDCKTRACPQHGEPQCMHLCMYVVCMHACMHPCMCVCVHVM